MKKTLNTLIFLIVTIIEVAPVQCFSQTHLIVSEYRTFINGKEMHIVLFSDSTYDFTTYWGTHHGFWEIIENGEDSLFDKIYFYDDAFIITKSVFYSAHISLNDTVVKQKDSLGNGSPFFFVTMFDITGESVPYYNVCFADSANEIIESQYNPNKEYKHFIPINTKKIGMIGEYRNLSTYFECNYSTCEGNIAFIIIPSVGRFYVNKERDIIRYRPCYCDKHNMNCYITFNKYSD